MIITHANGSQVLTDMPREIGGGAEGFTPGWLLRAALASCAATRIVMTAAAEGIELKTLELIARSRSDTRGLLGLTGVDGETVPAEPRNVELLVRICAPGVPPERVSALVEKSHRCSPVSCAMQDVVPVRLRVDVEAG